MEHIDIAPFALPNRAPGEYRFAEPRDADLTGMRGTLRIVADFGMP
jgi:hypothetical protein